MDAANTNFTDQLKELKHQGDLPGIEALVESLSPEALQQHKTEITDVYEDFFSEWLYYYDCGKIPEEDREGLIETLLEVLESAQKADPEKLYFEDRAICYRQFFQLKTAPAEKLHFLQKVMDEYTAALQLPGQEKLNASLASTLLDKMQVTKEFTAEAFNQVLELFERSLSVYSKDAQNSFLWSSFNILDLPFDEKMHWHLLFTERLSTILHSYAASDPDVYLIWAEELLRMLGYKMFDIDAAYNAKLNQTIISILAPLINLQTDDAEMLNRLGSAFEKAAKRMEDLPVPVRLLHYEAALRFYTEGHVIQRAAWTFVTYAANVLTAMAVIYHAQGNTEKVIEQFKTGQAIFEDVYEHKVDFSVNINWGEFLFEYARLAYDFKAPEILAEARLKGEIAKELGNDYYDHPYLLLAKIALAEGDKKQCLDILLACRAVFTNKYSTYGFSKVMEDKDFELVWPKVGSL